MSFTYDPLTPLGQVRLLSFDSDDSNAIFTDAEITALLGLNGQDVRLAAAQAVDILAANEAYVQKVVKIADTWTQGDKTAVSLQAYAKELRRQAYEGSGDMTGFFDWSEFVDDEFTARERVIKQFIRTQA